MTREHLQQTLGVEWADWKLFDDGRELGIAARWADGMQHAIRTLIKMQGHPTEGEFSGVLAALAAWRKNKLQRA